MCVCITLFFLTFFSWTFYPMTFTRGIISLYFISSHIVICGQKSQRKKMLTLFPQTFVLNTLYYFGLFSQDVISLTFFPIIFFSETFIIDSQQGSANFCIKGGVFCNAGEPRIGEKSIKNAYLFISREGGRSEVCGNVLLKNKNLNIV